MEHIRGELSEYIVAEKLKLAGYFVYRSLNEMGIDLLARKDNIEFKIQVKTGSIRRNVRGDGYYTVVGSFSGWKYMLKHAHLVLVVLPDHKVYVLSKRRIRRAVFTERAQRRSKLPGYKRLTISVAIKSGSNKLIEFNPASSFYLFTDVMVQSSTDESELAAQLPEPIPGYQNTAAFFPDENRAEVYLRETLKVIRRFYRSSAEEMFIHLVVTRLTANIIHEMIHAALLRSFTNEREIQRMAIVMTQ